MPRAGRTFNRILPQWQARAERRSHYAHTKQSTSMAGSRPCDGDWIDVHADSVNDVQRYFALPPLRRIIPCSFSDCFSAMTPKHRPKRKHASLCWNKRRHILKRANLRGTKATHSLKIKRNGVPPIVTS